MVAKISAGNTLYGVLAYNQIKVDDDHAKVLFTNRMIEPTDGIYDINTCLRSFEHYLLANNKTEKPVLHASINPDPKDVLSDEQLADVAQGYMRKMGYGSKAIAGTSATYVSNLAGLSIKASIALSSNLCLSSRILRTASSFVAS
jgi:hypothetical protein